MLGAFPGGKTRIASYVAALALLKENFGINTKLVLEEMDIDQRYKNDISSLLEQYEPKKKKKDAFFLMNSDDSNDDTDSDDDVDSDDMNSNDDDDYDDYLSCEYRRELETLGGFSVVYISSEILVRHLSV